MAKQTVTLPIIPLPMGTVLLPGVLQRILVNSSRPDIASLLATVYTKAASKAPNGRIDTVPIACVPIASHLLGPNGQLLIQNGERVDDKGHEETKTPRSLKSNLFGWGVSAKIAGVEGRGTLGNGEFTLLVEGSSRIQIEKIYSEKPFLEGKVTLFPDEVSLTDPVLDEQFQHLKLLSREYIAVLRLNSMLPNRPGLISPLLARRLDAIIVRKKLPEAGALADFMANIIVEISYEEKLQVLASLDVKERLAKVIELLDRKVGAMKNTIKVTTIASTSVPIPISPDASQEEIEKMWRSFRQPIPFKGPTPGSGSPFSSKPPGFLKGLGGGQDDDELNEVEELAKKLDAAKLSPEAAKVAERELRRLKKMVPQQAEYSVIRSYLETLADIPWTVTEDSKLDAQTLTRARKQLNDDHYGLDKVKRRVLEYIAVLRLKQSKNEEIEAQIKRLEEELAALQGGRDQSNAESTPESRSEDKIKATNAKLVDLKSKRLVDKSPILLFVGPPGVGKTSLARSIATALGRQFHRISLGGVRDEAEIRGHRLTYVAARPGLIAQALRKVGTANPVVLLDEIDKVGGSNFHGDPSAAMLEVLDPEQNHTFTDHYINIPIDLSKVMFIATANSLETIPPPLLDRMETIELPAYTTLMKREIASRHLLPKQRRINGLENDQVIFPEDVVAKIIESYTRESGVRNLERELGSVCRAKAIEYAAAKDAGTPETYSPRVTTEDLEQILGIERFEEEIAEKTSRPGIVTGLVAYSSGGNGSILFIEVADMPGNGTVQLTGKLGDVLKESVEVALSWVKAHAFDLGLSQDVSENIMKNRSIHVHCPSGSIPKDGPSSGVAQVIALTSLFSGKTVPPTLAMTGEISLRGRVLAVGGIKEKLIGALRAGVKTVLLPAQNRKDVRELPQEVKDGLEIIHVSSIWEAIRYVWPDSYWPGDRIEPML